MTSKQREIAMKDKNEFDISALIEPYRRELHLHCYRLLGSLHDAEDAVQETMLRAWRHFDTFKGQALLRTWLYTIATNTCLDMLKKRSPRTLPTISYPEADPLSPVPPNSNENLWLEPFPDTWLAEATESPEARYNRYESVSFAFLTALQLLPPRQRAILILSDVLDWRASEIGRLLEISVSAVNSALFRARTTLTQNYHPDKEEIVLTHHTDAKTNALLSRYMHAWETDDVAGLVALLKDDAVLSMPPTPSWYQGRDAIYTVFLTKFEMLKRWRLYPIYANGQPAFVTYLAREQESVYRAFGIQVVTLNNSQPERQITNLTVFHIASLVTSFGFPSQLAEQIDPFPS